MAGVRKGEPANINTFVGLLAYLIQCQHFGAYKNKFHVRPPSDDVHTWSPIRTYEICASVEQKDIEFPMSAPKGHRPTKEPPLRDPNHVIETFCEEVSMIQAGTDTCVITFGVRRLVDNGHGKDPTMERVVSSRIALPIHTVNELMSKLNSVGNARKMQDILSSADTTEKAN